MTDFTSVKAAIDFKNSSKISLRRKGTVEFCIILILKQIAHSDCYTSFLYDIAPVKQNEF